MTDPRIIYEDEHLLAVVKPAGLLVHTAENESEEPTLVRWLVARYPSLRKVGDDPRTRPGIVHRLDKDTSGVMVVAKTQQSFEHLKSLFQKHEVQKTYLALVFGKPKKTRGVIDAPIGIKSGTTKRSVRSSKMAKNAITFYTVKKVFVSGGETFSLLEVKPKTGRTHQIRVHLASLGHAVVGDCLYGPKRKPKCARRLMLHALSLEFTSIDGKRLRIEAEPPAEFIMPVIHTPP